MSANTLPSIFLLAVVGMLAGCGESKSDGGAPQSGANAAPATKPGSDTPQQAFEAARSALAKKDPKAMLDSGHPSQRQVFLAQFVMMGGMGTMGNEEKGKAFDALLQKHSVVADKTKSPLMIQDQAARTQALDQMFAGVKDQAALLGDLMQFFTDTYMRRHHGMDGGAIHDPCAVMALTHPHLFTRSRRHVVIELTGTHTRGMTLVDQRDLREVKEANCDVLETIDAEAAFAVMTDAIAHFSK